MSTDADRFIRTASLSEVTLRVRDVARVAEYYRDTIGLEPAEGPDGSVEFSGRPGDPPLLRLRSAPDAVPRRAGDAGLFHTAFLFPDRPSLARAANRLRGRGVPFSASDHGVSEALYLSDPEGNGIELYADRPSGEWPPGPDGESVGMFTHRLDIPGLLASDPGGDSNAAALPDIRIGHVHLCVSDLPRAERLYRGVIGLAIRQRDFPGALFYGFDGYHHHVATNVWQSDRPAAPDAAGLESFSLTFRDRSVWEAIRSRAAAEGMLSSDGGGRMALADADGWSIGMRVSDG